MIDYISYTLFLHRLKYFPLILTLQESRTQMKMESNILWFIAILTLITTGESKKSMNLSCHQNDLKALNSFKQEILADTSRRLETWTGKWCCEWVGISCHNKSARVTEINLPGFYSSDDSPLQTSMNGHLSLSLTLLTSLEVLDLSGLVDLKGTIPRLIGSKLPQLRKLSMWGNKFDGPLPESIGMLHKLEELYLYENSFSGPLPISIGNLNGLRVLDLHSNRFAGSIPESIANLTNLKCLFLQNNFLSQQIPANIGDLQALQQLDLSSNTLIGTIPSSVNKLNRISVIYLDNNRLEGEIPALTPGQMLYLSFLRLNGNSLTGEIPVSYGYLTSLQRLSLSNNKLKGSIPSSFGNLTSLTELYLNGNKLSGQIPRSMGQLSNLLILRVSQNMIQGPLPHELASLTNLQTLDLSFNKLILSVFPKLLLKLPSLSQVHLAGCEMEGEITEDLRSTPSPLQELDLSSNRLEGSIPEWIGNLKELYSLNLSSNFLTGQLPSIIKNLASLGILDLHSNNMTGSIKCVFQTQGGFMGGSLTFLDLSDNSFTDGVEQIGTETQQQILYVNLSRNLLKGRLPDSIGTLGLLQSLDLSWNSFNSDLPSSLANASSLEKLKLQKNHFSGKIPVDYLKLRNLRELDLSDNLLVGEIPPGEPLINFSKGSYLGNRGLCGKPLDPCRF